MFIKKLNLQFFAADESQGGGDEGQGNGKGEGDKSGADPSKTDKTIPYDRFKEVNDERNDFKTKYDALLKEKEEADTKAKTEQGKFEELYNNLSNEYEPKKKQLEQYQETFKEILKVKIDTVPEEFRDLIPEGDDSSKLQWIEKSIVKGLFKKETITDFGNNGSNPGNQETDLSKMNPKQLLSMGYEKSKK